MAMVTEIDTGTTQNGAPPPPDPPKRGPGRPRKVRPPVVDEDDDETPAAASPEKARMRADRDIWLELANYKPADWDQTIAYLYRVAPTVDRRSGGRPINIRKYAGPFDKDRIMLDEGSGVYRIDILRIDPVDGKYTRWAKEYFDILNMDYPPRVPAGDWIDDPANEVWKWAGPKLLAQQQQQNGGAMYPPGFSIDKVYDKAFDLAEKMNPKQADSAKGEATLLTTVVTLIEKLSPKVDNTATDKLFAMMSVQLKETRDELREMRTKGTAPPKSIIEQIAELKPVVGEFAAIFAEKSGSRAPWWEGPLEKLVESVPDVIQLVKAQQQPVQPVQNMALAPPLGFAGAPGGNQPPPVSPPPAATGTPEEQQFQALLQKWRGHINTILPPLIRFFKKNEDERGGLHFRDWYFDGYDETHWLDLRREVGAGGLLFIINNHPPLKAELSPEPQLHLFLKEFFMNVGEEFKEEEPQEAPDELKGAA